PGRIEALEQRHRNVHQDNIRAQSVRHFDGLQPVEGFTDNVDIRLRRQNGLHPFAEQRMIVANEYAQFIVHRETPPASGKSTSIRVPRRPPSGLAGHDCTWTFPPSTAMRSRMAVRPNRCLARTAVVSKPTPSSSIVIIS